MIKKTLLIAVVLVLTHAVLVSLLPPSLHTAAQNQWQANLIKAQRFIYKSEGNRENVFIGSSLSCMLDMTRFPSSYYNLAFYGMGGAEGLHILDRSGAKVDHVFIEMYLSARPEDQEFTKELFSPFSYTIERIFPALRQQNQPVSILAAFGKKGSRARPAEARPVAGDWATAGESEIFKKMLRLQVEERSQVPDRAYLDSRVGGLKRYVDDLEKRRAHVIFYEMPMHPAVCASPMTAAVRQAFHRIFPPSKYRYIPAPDCARFHTSDGLHLTREEAAVYSDYLMEQADQAIRALDGSSGKSSSAQIMHE
jgi:hypothetical protein